MDYYMRILHYPYTAMTRGRHRFKALVPTLRKGLRH